MNYVRYRPDFLLGRPVLGESRKGANSSLPLIGVASGPMIVKAEWLSLLVEVPN